MNLWKIIGVLLIVLGSLVLIVGNILLTYWYRQGKRESKGVEYEVS